MHFLDEVMFDLGQFFDAFSLLAKLLEQDVLFGGKPVHPPKANAPANGAGQSHPECQATFIHNLSGRGSSIVGTK
jgi:hypothetical protein